jgi:UrcA family protein
MFQSLASLTLAPALALTATSALAAPVTSDAATDVRTTAVAYGDLDLSTARGRHQLDVRLQRAADAVCGVDHTVTDLAESAARSTCRNHALIDARHALARKTTDMTLVRR